VLGKEIKCGEGYLVEDEDTARRLFSEFTKRGYRGIHVFGGSPHFSFENVQMYDFESIGIEKLIRNVRERLREEEGNALFLEFDCFSNFNTNDALSFICLIKDIAVATNSCLILFFEGDRKWRQLLEGELVRI